MVFPTITFAIFFAVVLPVSWALAGRPAPWKIFVVIASYVFYAAADWTFLFLLGGITVGNHLFALAIHAAPAGTRRKWLVRVAVTLNLLLLGVFKYYGFFIEEAAGALESIGINSPLPVLTIALPIGISFITFHAISYVVDVGRGQLEPPKLIDLAVYMSFFPHLVAGPIVRASEFLPQLERPLDPRRVAVGTGVLLIIVGLVKKVVIADSLAREVVDPVFAVPEAYASADVLLACFGYAVQIYCDFSGYTDIAIGVALLMGLTFPKNFDRPFASTSVTDFWRRWHMTLSRFVRDYVYIPLGGARVGPVRAAVNSIITMVVIGFWHGAAWTFVIFGLIHGVTMVLERVWTVSLRWRPPPWLNHTMVILFLIITLVPFRAPDMNTVFAMWGQLGAAGPATLWEPLPVLMIAAVMTAHLMPLRIVFRARQWVANLPVPALSAGLASTVVLVAATIPSQGVPPFIYFQF